MNTIPPLDLTAQYREIAADVEAAVLNVLASGHYIGGSMVEGFEQELAQYIGVRECVACNSGTDALFLALRALNIGPGDEVITTAFTFFATAEVITAVGATPVFVDIAPETFTMALEQVEAAITPCTKAIIPVHLFGQPEDMSRLMAIAHAHQLAVIEDCAQATGAEWQGQKVGSFGQMGCFSFYPTKNLGACGDGGAITTNDAQLAAQLRMLRDHGSKVRYYHEAIGLNSRLDAIQAAILRIKLTRLEAWNQQRQAVADRYHQLLANMAGLTCPVSFAAGRSVWNQYTVRISTCPTNALRCADAPCQNFTCRDWLRGRLKEEGIITMVYYPLPMHLQPVYQNLGYIEGQLPLAERACREVLSLPMFPELTLGQQQVIAQSIKRHLS